MFKNLKNHLYETEPAKWMKIALKLRKKVFHSELECFRLLFRFPLPSNKQNTTVLFIR